MRPAAVLLALALLAGTAFADDADEVRRLDREITVATWAGDEKWFEEHLGDDYVLVTPAGSTKNKREVIRELMLPGMKMEPYEPSEVNVRIYSDAAIVTGRILQRFTFGSSRYSNDLRYTNVYVKRKSRWMLVSAHVSPVAIRR